MADFPGYGEPTVTCTCSGTNRNTMCPIHGDFQRGGPPISSSDAEKIGLGADVMVRYALTAPATPAAKHIIYDLVPQVLDDFIKANTKYQDVDQVLGAAGVFPDINRKVGILKTRVWHGKDTPGEPTAEVIGDLIGHLLLMLDMLYNDKGGDKAQ